MTGVRGVPDDVMTVETARDLVERLARLSALEVAYELRQLDGRVKRRLLQEWAVWALPGQVPPDDDWRAWLIRAGRGFGKTRTGAEWVNAVARTIPDARIALVGGTATDVARIMVEGESGVLAVAATGELPEWRRGVGEIHWEGGARAYVYSAEAPERLRGPQHHAAWCDELGAWRYGDVTWDNLMLGLRLGDRQRVLVTTTPQPNTLMRRVIALPGLRVTTGRTADNPHLSEEFVAAVHGLYSGTRLGRQELDGELIEEVAGALWTRGMIERCRDPAVADDTAPSDEPWRRVVVGVDPPASAGGDLCGIVAVALDAGDVAHVLVDASIGGVSPEGWARVVSDCARRVGADRVVAERNQGGDMVASVLLNVDPTLPVKLVHASKGKVVRAEPVALLYERGRVRHRGCFAALEDELCGLMVGGDYVPAGPGAGRSPDRADALVWAVHELMLTPRRAAAQLREL